MLQLKNISKTFGPNNKALFNELNLQIEHGEFCVILGNNGSGKSTLLKIISGEKKLDSGQIFLNRLNLSVKPIEERAYYISSVSQDITKGTIQELSVMENISLSYLRKRDVLFALYERNRCIILPQLKKLGLRLEHLIDHKMSDLSGGQRQAIATLMATYPTPALLLLDEHSSALDPKMRVKIMEFTNDIIKENKITTLMVTHNIQDAIKYGDRLIVMSYGKIIHDFKGEEKLSLTEEDILTILTHAEDSHA